MPLLLAGLGVGALASQLGAVTVSAVPDEQSGEVGGLQNTATNLGASLGTALAGSVLIAALTALFLTGIQSNPDVPDDVSRAGEVELAGGIPFVSDADLSQRARRRRRAPGRPRDGDRRRERTGAAGRGDVGVVERGFEVGVGDERDPARQLDLRLRRTGRSGTAGLLWMPVKNDAVSAEISTAPASAVPIEAPRLVNVFWRPPTSPLCSSGTAETVTAPSCEASAPMPSPASSIGQ